MDEETKEIITETTIDAVQHDMKNEIRMEVEDLLPTTSKEESTVKKEEDVKEEKKMIDNEMEELKKEVEEDRREEKVKGEKKENDDIVVLDDEKDKVNDIFSYFFAVIKSGCIFRYVHQYFFTAYFLDATFIIIRYN